MWNRQLLSRACWAVVAVIALTMPAAWCQTITGAITGSVTDSSGAAIPGAIVTATNTGTGVATPTQTNQSGFYNLRFLQIGQYTVSVSASGFSTQTTNSFALEVSQEARIDVKLAVGSAAQTVNVTSAAPILNTENPTTGDSITAAQATELPLQARNFSSLTTLVAGAVTPNPSAQNSVARASYNGGFFVNGNREQTNNYTLDGADINEAIDNYIGYSPNVDAIGELRVITGNATAEYGNANGGQVVMVTKSGTNQFHGDAFWFLENTNLNANSWTNKFSGITQVPVLNRSIFGGTLGGPIFKDRLFFFVDYQGARQHLTSGEGRSVPTLAMRSGFAPALGHNVPITNPAAQYLLAHPELYPAPNAGSPDSPVKNYNGTYGTATHNNQGDVKIDAKINDKDSISGRFSIGRETDGYTKVTLPTDIPSNNDNPYTGFIFNWTHVFSPHIVNEARAGVGRTRYITIPSDLDGQFGLTGNQKLGIPGTQLVPGISTFDLTAANVDPIGTTGQSQGNGSYAGIDSDSIVNAFTYGDNVSWQLGRHSIKFGGQALRYQENRYYSGNDGTLGWFLYSSRATGDAWADFLENQAFSFGQGAVTGRWGQRQWRDALFFQDDYKLRDNLTINLGLRWEWDQPLYEVNNKMVNVNLATGAVERAGVDGNSRALYNGYWGGFMPRVGFAFSPERFNGKFVIRGGYGITNFLEGTGANLRLTLNPPFFVDSSSQSDGATYFQTQNGFPRPANAATLGGNVRVWDPHLKPAFIQQFNLTTETQLNNTTSLVVAYLGQTGNHLVTPQEGNQRQCPTCPLPVSSLPGLSAVAQVSLTQSESVMNYNALQITGRRRLAQGLEFLSNYTWSKALSNNLGYYGAGGGAGASQSAYWQNAYDGGADYGPAFFDATHNFSFSGYYDLPFGRGRLFGNNVNRIVDEGIGGWKLGAIASLHSGFPITVASPQFYNVNQRANRANQYRRLLVRGRSTAHWFGTDPTAAPCASDVNNGSCAYGEESSTGFGTARVGSERAPHYADFDMAASKGFAITEGSSLQFRADFFNVLNTSSLAPPTNDVSQGNFGQITSTVSTERQIQLALKLVF
jgi:hypothetical protein